MHTHEKLDAESYEAAFLFRHFISSCHAEACEECCTDDSDGSCWPQPSTDGTDTYSRPRLRTRSASGTSGWERCSALAGLSMSAIKAFIRKKHEHCNGSAQNRCYDALKGPGTASTQHARSVTQSLGGPGFICAYCTAKFLERRLLIKHLLGDHGCIAKMGMESTMHLHIQQQ